MFKRYCICVQVESWQLCRECCVHMFCTFLSLDVLYLMVLDCWHVQVVLAKLFVLCISRDSAFVVFWYRHRLDRGLKLRHLLAGTQECICSWSVWDMICVMFYISLDSWLINAAKGHDSERWLKIGREVNQWLLLPTQHHCFASAQLRAAPT